MVAHVQDRGGLYMLLVVGLLDARGHHSLDGACTERHVLPAAVHQHRSLRMGDAGSQPKQPHGASVS